GRADPWGGFWIGTMGKNAEAKAGAIYRFAGGVLRQIVCDITISNAICFAPDKTCAYYTDTATQKVMRQPLNPKDGWADGAAEVFLDLHAARLNPDGAVTDAQGNLWIAMWGASAVVCFDPQGRERDRINVPARQPSCPAFGGQTLCDLYVTTAHYGVWEKERAERPHNGATFVIPNVAQGVAEPRVIL
ncbi:MAG: SMP-30/gluconolactonase/LRE family protein, partial [Pseudomonadota bacterium]